ncbi:MAG TPA: thioredoxin family protein [Terriglobales bacterium]|nr:thioredoxin family protein [Terriglobales bacterium]
MAIENPGLRNWKSALMSLDATVLAKLYTSNAAATTADGEPQDLSADEQFWRQFVSQKPQELSVLVRGTKEQPGMQVAALTVSFKENTLQGLRSRYILVQQFWQREGDEWRIVAAKHSGVLKMPQPASLNPNLYPRGVDAHQEIKEAIERASHEHKRVILIFGANWCYDCHVLDFALHHSDAAPVAEKNFVIVHVDIGEGKLNPDLVSEYKIPLDKGVPALAVLDSNGKLLYSQQNGEFESARSMDPDELIAFLEKWKPKT